MSKSNLDRGDVEKVHGSVLEGLGPLEQDVKVRADRHAPHGPAGEPGAAELRERWSPREEASNSRGVSEHLVERHRNEVWVPLAQVESVGRYVGRPVQK